MKKLFKKIGVRHLIVFLLLMLTLDEMHCTYLASQYNCAISELYEVVGFDWLDSMFGIVELMLGIMILLKSYSFLANEPKMVFFDFPIMRYTLHVSVNLNWLKHKLSRIFGGFIAFISISSLIMDVILFLQKWIEALWGFIFYYIIFYVKLQVY